MKHTTTAWRHGFTAALICLIALSGIHKANAQTITQSESFDNVSALTGNGWSLQNLSSSTGVTGWAQGDAAMFPQVEGTGYAGADYYNASGAATISNWLIAPPTLLHNGDRVSFYTRTPAPVNFPDRLQVRLSTNGASSNVGSNENSVGDFTTLLVEINPSYSTAPYPAGYPTGWTKIIAIINGLSSPTTGRIAFRYFVEDGGPGGTRSNYIGIDNYAVVSGCVSNASSTNVSICPSQLPYTWNGKVYTTSTTDSVFLDNGSICDSVAVLNLTVINNSSSVTNQYICADAVPYLWNGFSLNSSATRTVHFTNAAGCDSAATLHLIVNKPANAAIPSATITYRTCDSLNFNVTGSFSNAQYLHVLSPVDTTFQIGTASFGPSLVSNSLALNSNLLYPSPVLGCNPGYAGGTLSGKIAVIDRGTCTFTDKVKNAQNAGAIAVIIVNNTTGIANMSGTDATITIPVFSVTQTDGNLIKTWLNNNATIQGYTMVHTDSIIWSFTDANHPTITPFSNYLQSLAISFRTNSPFNLYLKIKDESGCTSVSQPYVAPIKNSSTSTLYNATCFSNLPLAWMGKTFTANHLTDTLKRTNAVGCDSIVTLNVSVGNATTSDTTVSICNSYRWNDSTYKASGDYTFRTTNAAGCDSIANLHLTVLSVTSAFVKTDALCNGSSTGSITVNPTYGVPPFTYKLGTVAAYGNSNSFSNLKAGLYRVSILDATGCAGISDQITIAQQPALTATVSKTDPTCFGGSNGSITVTPTNGSAPYQYRFGTSGSYAANNTFAARAGTYRIYVQDAAGCNSNLSVTVGQPADITATFIKKDETCPLAKDGFIVVNGAVGIAPYQYKFGTAGTYAANNSFTGLRAGSYRVYLKDSNGCGNFSVAVQLATANSTCVSLIPFARTTGSAVQSPGFNVSLYPNPSKNNFTVVANSSTLQPVNVRVLDAVGKKVYEAKGTAEQPFRFGASFAPGLYLVEVRQCDEVKTLKAVKVR